jgi:hypothetical protein
MFTYSFSFYFIKGCLVGLMWGLPRMLMMRMVGGSSIQAISSLMKYDNLEYSSVGSISSSSNSPK